MFEAPEDTDVGCGREGQESRSGFSFKAFNLAPGQSEGQI